MTTRLRWWLWLGTMCGLGALHCGSDDPAAPPAASGGSAGAGAKAGSAGTAGSGQTSGGTAGAAGTNGGGGTAGTNGGSGTAGTNGGAGTAGTNGGAGTAGAAGGAGTAGTNGGAGDAGAAGSGGTDSDYPAFPIPNSRIWVEAGRNTLTGPGGLVTKAFDLGYADTKPFGLYSTDGLGPTLDTSDAKRPFIDFKASHGLALTYGQGVLDNFTSGYSLYFYVRSTKATDYGPLFDCGVDQNKENFDPLVNRIFFGRAVEDDRLKYIVFNAQGGIASEMTVTSDKLNENAFHLIGIAQNAAGAMTISIDGAPVGTANTPGTLPTSLQRPYCYVGKSLYHNGFQGNQDYDGDLRAVFGFGSALSNVQLEQLMIYVNQRWQ